MFFNQWIVLQVLPPVRKPRYSEKPKTFKDQKNEKKRIKSSDYKAWEQFDVVWTLKL